MAARVQKVAPGQELYKGPQTTLQGRWRSPTGMGVDDVLEYEKLLANGQEDARDEEWFQRKYGYDWYGFPEWKRMAFRKRERQKALDDYKRRLAAQIAEPLAVGSDDVDGFRAAAVERSLQDHFARGRFAQP